MGRGNVCVWGKCEGLYYIDNDDIMVYSRSDGDPDGVGCKLIRDLTYEEMNSDEWEFDEVLTDIEYDTLIANFKEDFMTRFKSFTRCDKWLYDYGRRDRKAILENELFYICTEDNQWSVAVELIQKEEPYGEPWMENLQRRHYERYLDGIKRTLLTYLPSIGTYSGAWTAGTLRREDVA